MTNGEMMQKIFQDMEIEIGEIDAYVWINHEPSHFDKTWWNAEYKEPNCSEIPTGSTAKNDLAVDCISRAEVIDIVENTATEWLKGDVNFMYPSLIKKIKGLSSVTPQEPRWIPVKFRPLTDEEQNTYPDYCYMADCPMPDDGEEILVCTVYGTVEKDECGFDDGVYLDSGYDWQTDIAAWMPLPKPYEPQESEG